MTKTNFKYPHIVAVLVATLLVLGPCVWAADTSAPAKGNACADVPHADHPKALISNGSVDALVFLPDAQNGYYRSSRFDWSGVVGCLSYNGHTFFGEWFPRYDPQNPRITDAITGPVEEFRNPDSPLGYNEAKPGEPFVKIGVGLLRRIDDRPYRYPVPYQVVDPGKWTVRTTSRSVSFKQELKGPHGYAYVYEKTLVLDKKGPGMTLEHRLKNTGKRPIAIEVYDHDFYMLDKQHTGPGMVIRFPFEPKAERPLEPGAKIDGKTIVYLEDLPRRGATTSFLTGFSNSVSDYDFTFENTKTGVGVEQSADSPIVRFNLWSIPTTVAPEAYVGLNIPPGKTGHWKIHYRFFAPPK